MPRLNLDLTAITTARGEAGELRRAGHTGARHVADLQASITRARQNGADAQTLARLHEELERHEAELRGTRGRQREALARVDALAVDLLARRDPANMVEALDGNVPMALLPVRLETRYLKDPLRLAIRIYPDALHVLRHGAGLTAAERARGEAYWQARFARDPADGDAAEAEAEGRAAALWREMVALYRAPRAAWIVRTLTPTNLDALGQADTAPVFPDDIDDVTSGAKQAFATALPDRWCAVGIRQGQEVFRVWGQHVADVLPMAPVLDPAQPLPEGEGLFGGDRAWLVDFGAALQAGMAIEVRAQDLADGFDFDQGVDRLVVLGVDWTLDAEASAAMVGGLLQAHQAAADFSFAPLGTPTNNTGRAVSGFSSAADTPMPPLPAQVPEPGRYAAAERLRDALGLDDSALDAPNIANAALDEPATAMHMINALWRATFGRYLSLMWNPWFAVGADDDQQPDRYVKKQVVAKLRDFAMQYLRPSGPLPNLRIDKQPYGVLPVVAPSYQPDSSFDGGVRKVLAALRPRWKLSAQKVPHLVDGNLQSVTELLQTGPWSRVAKARGVDNPMMSLTSPVVFSDDQELMIGNQQSLKAEWTDELLGLFGISKELPRDAMIDMLLLADPPRALAGVPWVEADPVDPKRERAPEQALGVDAQGKNYIHAIHDALGLDKGQAKQQLNARQGGSALLETLLAFSAEEEFDHGGIAIVEATDRVTASKPWGRTVVAQAAAAEINIEAPLQTESWRELRSTREVAKLRVASVTGSDTIEDHLARGMRAVASPTTQVAARDAAQRFIDGRIAQPWYFKDLSLFKQSLSYLAGRRVGELDIAFKTTMDAYGYRLDAWYTALATRRLEAVRKTRPQGVHLGGYGWVERLPRPMREPDSLGFVHAPSLPQAATAAILRSGHLANHESAKSSFNMDLSSERVRRAHAMLEGVSHGQSLAELLGYRFERGLRDALLGHCTLPFRLAYPLKPAGDALGDQPQESIAARDVVDGIKLLEAYAGGFAPVRVAVLAAVDQLQPVPDWKPAFVSAMTTAQATIDGLLKSVAETWDAVSDVLVAEGVYQVVQGNLERAGAALAVLDKQDRPVEPQVTRTPRIGVSYAQRVLVACQSTAMDERWQAAGADDPRAAAEPLLNAWLARMLGDPARFVFEARVARGDVIDATPLTLSPQALGWSPLTVVLASRAVSGAGQAQHSALRARIAQQLAAQVANPDEHTQLMIESGSSQPGKLGLAAFEALASTLGRLVESARALTRKDVVVPRDEIEAANPADAGEYAGSDLAEIEARAAAAVTALEAYLDNVRNAAVGPALAQRLLDGWMFGIVEAQPGTAPDAAGEAVTADATVELFERRRSRALAQGQSQLDAANALAPGAPEQAGASHSRRVQNAIDRIKAVFGKAFPVLPRFTLGAYAGSVAGSLAARSSLLAGDDWAIPGWLTKLSRVREGSDRLNAALSAHEAMHAPLAAAQWKLVQLPYKPDDCWGALPQRWANPERKPDTPRREPPRLAWVAHAPDALQDVTADTAIGGLLVDEWQEFVPSAWQTTAISFHYDAPGSRPPQAVLLAVPPRLDMANWTFGEVLATVNEAFDLAQLRAVRPQDLTDGLGLMLPANYMPENPSEDVPGVRITDMIRAGALKYSASIALGKG
ncbi:hypothetical protein ACFOLC_14230 [Lysobacter cavernae]|uniref:Uncharacterized protein n=1 Tax=Lysobacter cavernae TaxID=1685901 RepID=A0ABV7RTD1_9GAMM